MEGPSGEMRATESVWGLRAVLVVMGAVALGVVAMLGLWGVFTTKHKTPPPPTRATEEPVPLDETSESSAPS